MIRDVDIKWRLGQWYLSAWQAATADMKELTQPYRHGKRLAEQMESVPVLILACIDHGQADYGFGPVTRGASIYPAVQNLMLAAWSLGLGTVLTTPHFFVPGAFEAILGVPSDVTVTAALPIGYPKGNFGPTKRPSAERVVSWDRF